jgi:hypothetical protein
VNISPNTPGFTAEAAFAASNRCHRVRSRTGDDLVEKIIPAISMPYCEKVCGWRVCGSPLPGYPAPKCYSCEEVCWMHESGPYRAIETVARSL